MQRFLKALLSLPLFLVFLPAATAQAADPVVQVDRIVAVVDREVITYGELQDRIRLVLEQLEKQGNPRPPQDALEKQVLERVINDRLQMQLASQTGIRVDDNQLDRTLERIAEQNKLSMRDFRQALERDGVSFAKFREDIRNEIIITRLREREVENRIVVTEAEIDNLLTTQSSREQEPDEFDLSHILISTPEEASPEVLQKLRAKAEEALQRTQSGEDFAEVAARYSDAPNALEGGRLGWKTVDSLPDLFVDVIQPLKPGEISQILRSPNGYHILKLNNRRGGSSPLIVQQTRVRHILVKLNELVSEEDAQHRLNDLRERLIHGGADFAELARLHSEDGSAANGGELGWVNPGDTVPEFEKAMNALKPGDISAPTKSPFGWHLIQVLERRSQDMSNEAARLKARKQIRARKSEEAFQEWLRELRDRAYIEYRLEDKY